MRRRDVTFGTMAVLLGCAAARAQSGIKTVGTLIGLNPADEESQARIAALKAGLEQKGWEEGRTITYVHEWPVAGDLRAMERSAARLIERNCHVIVANGDRALGALQKLTSSLPLVVAGGGVASGLSRNPAHPPGNATGVLPSQEDLATPLGKAVQWLYLLKPQQKRLLVLVSRTNQTYLDYLASGRQLQTVGSGLEIRFVVIDRAEELADKIAADLLPGVTTAVVVSDVLLAELRTRIIKVLIDLDVIAVYPYRSFAAAGGIVSYGLERSEAFSLAAEYVDRLLRGARPSDLPLQAPTRYQLVINRRAAGAQGVLVPDLLLASADEVID